jgi:hypothetical protein
MTSKPLLPPAPTTVPAGRITASALSAYDLPDYGDVQPIYITMNTLGAEVKTGPPTARHRDRNSFRFTKGKDSDAGGYLHI